MPIIIITIIICFTEWEYLEDDSSLSKNQALIS